MAKTKEAAAPAISLVEFVAGLPDNRRTQLIDFTLCGAPSLMDIQRYLLENYDTNYPLAEVAAWKQTGIAPNVQVSQINLSTGQFDGIDEVAALEFSLAKIYEQINYLTTQIELLKIEDSAIEELSEEEFKKRIKLLERRKKMKQVDLPTAYRLLPNLLKEQSSLVAKLNALKFINDREELLLSGADLTIRFMETHAKKLKNGGEITLSLCKAAWANAKKEVGHQ